MKRLDQLDAIEATFTLNRASNRLAGTGQISDQETASKVLRAAVSSVAGDSVAEQIIDYVISDESGEVARIVLAEIAERRDLFRELADEVDQMLVDPPRADQLDFGISLGALTLAGLAMILMCNLEISSTKETLADGSSSEEFRFRFQGNEKVATLVTKLISKLGF